MVTAVRCDSPIEGLVLRIVKLNSCGVPVTGTTAAGAASIVFDGFTKVSPAPQYDNGARKITRKADGTLCLNFKQPDQYTNDEVTVDFCAWNPGVPVITMAARLLTATESPTGTGFARGTWSNYTPAHFSLEVWQAPPQACDASGVVRYPYHAWPHLADGKQGNWSIGEDSSQLQLVANTYDGSPLWTPGNTYLGANQVVLGDHYLRNLQNTAPPPSQCAILDYP
jgi:hypothetical protein